VPDLALALLVGIHPLCKAGCRVIFDNDECDVEYDGKVILQGYKDPSTNLWMLPITPDGMQSTLSQPPPFVDHALHPKQTLHNSVNLASIMHSVRTQSNGVKFAHQSPCNPKNLNSAESSLQRFPKRLP
jgi:hypothetical protein